MKLLFLIFSFWFFSQDLLASDLLTQVHPITLSNGMKWLVVYRPGLPIFSGIVVVRAGGADETPGKTGLAHMFEHMAFKGSKVIGTKDYKKEKPILDSIDQLAKELFKEHKKENPDPQKVETLRRKIQELQKEADQYSVKNAIWDLLARKGAVDLNAFTTKDVTAYHTSMPKEEFPLWARITSEMVFDPVLREFYQERDVVMEERRLRYDNSPQGFLFEELMKTAYPTGPYHLPPIGEPEDLLTLTADDAYRFHARYYVPQNIVGVLVGAISPSEANRTLEKFYGRKKGRWSPVEAEVSSFGFQGEEKKTIRFLAEPYLAIAFHKPNAPQREDYLFDVIDGLLCDGRSSRLYQEFVIEKRWASHISCAASFPGSRYENLFIILASPNRGTDLEKLEEGIFEALDRLKKEVRPEELEKVRANVLFRYYWGLEDNLNLAEQLAVTQAVIQDWRYVVKYPKVIETVTKEEVSQVAEKYFVPENRVVIYRVRGR